MADLCRKHGLRSPTFDRWKAKYGGMNVSEARRLKALEDENAKLKRVLADSMLDNVALKDLLGKKVVTPAAHREAAAHLQLTFEMSERRACRVFGHGDSLRVGPPAILDLDRGPTLGFPHA